VTIAPAPRYAAGAIHRFFLGSTYRRLWATPIRVAVLQVDEFGGGLTAYETGGSGQSHSLRFRTAEGRTYAFRSLDKDPTRRWPEALRKSPARDIAEDQISSIFPAGALAVGVLEDAAGLLHTDRWLVVLPDSPRLGKWRDEFKGSIGILEPRLSGKGDLRGALAGASEVVDSDTLFARLRASDSNRLDRETFLKARLLDLLVGDWDRHADQWYWVGYEEENGVRWVSMPRDRDWALSHMDGLAYSLARLYSPNFVKFGPEYGSAYGMSLHSEPLDRRLLSPLDRKTWDSVTKDLQARLTDSVIAAAVGALPKEFGRPALDRLGSILEARREALPQAAEALYRQLAGEVEVWGTDAADRVAVTHDSAGGLTVRIEGPNGPEAARRFDPDETSEVRLRLFGGSDTVRIKGAGSSGIGLRIVTGGGRNLVVDSTGADRVRVYDDSASTAIVATGSVSHTRRPFTSPVPANSPLAIHRDWGALMGFQPWFEIGPEIGLLVGGGPVVTKYGFRKVPYASRYAVRAAYATGASGINADLTGDIRFERPDLRLGFRLATVNTDVQRFYGLGNDTERPEASDFYRVMARSYLFEPELEKRLGTAATLSLGGTIKRTDTDFDRPSLLQLERPYGSGEFTAAGVRLGLQVDTRDDPANATKGIRIAGRFSWFPRAFDVEEAFQTARLDASGYLTARGAPASPTLAVRVGGAKAWHPTPFFELPALGGMSSLRGFNSRRFLGDRSVFGSAELRLHFGDFRVLAPGEWGIYGLSDLGRVYLTGVDSDRWHSSFGGGLWFAFVDRRSTMTVTYAASDERGRFYIRAGFAY
jgi:hypothetical protein